MMPHAMNISARDNRNTGSLTGLGFSRLALLEHLFLICKKIIGKGQLAPRASTILVELGIFRVHRVQAVINDTGGGFQTKNSACVFCSSREDFIDLSVRSSYE